MGEVAAGIEMLVRLGDHHLGHDALLSLHRDFDRLGAAQHWEVSWLDAQLDAT